MKIAIVHDELIRKGGAERVTLAFQKAFPDAPIYTSVYRENLTFPAFKNSKIYTSILNKFITDEKKLKKFFFPWAIIAMKNLKINDYDIVLISSTHCGKYVSIAPGTKIVTYCHTPFRLAWLPETYYEYINSSGLRRRIFNLVVKILKKIDYDSARKATVFLTNAHEIVNRIKKYYNWDKEIKVINPPINCDEFYIERNPTDDYYVVVSRLEYYKKVNLVIEAFNKLGKKIVIVGKGSQAHQLKALAGKNVEFRSNLENSDLAVLYSNAKALIFPQYEDYGITPLEANASGIPVIAYGQGGIKETMIPYKNNAAEATALFYNEQTTEAVENAIIKFETLKFDRDFIRGHAEKFDEKLFVKKIQDVVQSVYQQKST